MDSSIQLKCKVLFRTIEIKDGPCTQELTTESHSKNVVADLFPEETFGFCWILSHFSCKKKLVPWSASSFSSEPPFLLGRKGLGDGGSFRRSGDGGSLLRMGENGRNHIQCRERVLHISRPTQLLRAERGEIDVLILREEYVHQFPEPLFGFRIDHGARD